VLCEGCIYAGAVDGFLHRTAASQDKEATRDVQLSVAALAKLDALKDRLQLQEAGYAEVVDWLLESEDLQLHKAASDEDLQHVVAKRYP